MKAHELAAILMAMKDGEVEIAMFYGPGTPEAEPAKITGARVSTTGRVWICGDDYSRKSAESMRAEIAALKDELRDATKDARQQIRDLESEMRTMRTHSGEL